MTRMPDAYYKSLELEIDGVLEEVIGIIPSSGGMSQIQEFIDVGEYGLALETLCGVLIENGFSIPKSIHQKISKLALQMGINPKIYEGIKCTHSH